jgi:SulP family sulfate permease
MSVANTPTLEDVAASGPAGGPWSEALFRYVPAIDSLRNYSFALLRRDLGAGLTVAAVAVPQAMAYAMIAGIPPQYALYTAIVMTAVGAVLDSSKQLINGPTNVISIAVASALAHVTPPLDAHGQITAAITLALLVGITQTLITLLRLGDLTRYISHAVIIGFTAGATVMMVLEQVKNFLGIAVPAQVRPTDHFLVQFAQTMAHGRIHGWTTAVSIGTVVLVLGLRWLNARRGWRVPEFLSGVVLAALAVWAFDLGNRGVRLVGVIPPHLPAPALPRPDWDVVRDLSGSALAIALLGLLEAIAMAKAIAAQTGQKLDINQQCLSEGLANLTGSFFQCYPGSGSLSRSAINQQAGAATQWSGVISAIAVALTVVLFAPFARYIPRAALAGILMVTAWRMIDRRALLHHLRATRFDAGILIATAAAGLIISMEFCILIGTFLSFLFYVPRAARVHMAELVATPERVLRERIATDPRCDRMRLYSIEGELFFGAAPDLEEHLAAIEQQAQGGVRVVVLRVKRARNPDAVCLNVIEQFLKRMAARGVTVLFCGVRHDMAKILRNTGLEERLGKNRIFRESADTWSSTLDAVRAAYDILGGDLCTTCPRRQERQQHATGDWYYMI